MQPRNIILLAMALMMLGAIAILLFKVKGKAKSAAPAVAGHQTVSSPGASENPKRSGDAITSTDRTPSAKERGGRTARRARGGSKDAGGGRASVPGANVGAGLRKYTPKGHSNKIASPALTFNTERAGAKAIEQRLRKLYDSGQHIEALEGAEEALGEHPKNLYLLRVAVSSACAVGDDKRARKYLVRLPKRDQAQMKGRCDRSFAVNLD